MQQRCAAGQAAAQPTKPQAAPPLQAASDFSDKLAADAETVLQSAGRISKAMTDAMDVTKHNNVGINVMLMSSLGALGKTMSLVAQQYKALAAASNAVAAAEADADFGDRGPIRGGIRNLG